MDDNKTLNSSFLKPEDFTPGDWVIYGIIIIQFALAIYVFCAVVCYFFARGSIERRVGEHRKHNGHLHDSANSHIELNSNQNHYGNEFNVRKATKRNVDNGATWYKLTMLITCVFTALLCLVHFALEQAILFSPDGFDYLQLADRYVYGGLIVLGYAFFWIRQRLFYNDSSPIRHLHKNRYLKICSSLSLVFVVLNATTQLVLVWFWHVKFDQIYEAISWLVGCTLVQSTLLVLFLYPLHVLNKQRKRFFGKKSEGRMSVATDSVQSLVRRCLLLAVVHFFTDFINVILRIVNSSIDNPQLSVGVMLFTDLNCLCNTAGLVGSFSNWKTMIFPWKALCGNDHEHAPAVAVPI